jgi:hypothetical protein
VSAPNDSIYGTRFINDYLELVGRDVEIAGAVN